MRRINVVGILFLLLAISAAAGVLSLVVLLSRDAWQSLQASDPNVIAAILFGYGALVLCVVAVLAYHSTQRRFRAQQALHDWRCRTYAQLLEVLFNLGFGPIPGERINRKAAIKKLNVLQQELLLCGSERVLRCIGQVWGTGLYLEGWDPEPEDEDESDTDYTDAMAQLYFAIRRDLGHTNIGLDYADLIQFFAAETLLEAQPNNTERT